VSNFTQKNRVELILYRLLKTQASLEDICAEARVQFTDQTLSIEELEIIATFFLYAGQSTSLVEFFLKLLIQNKQIPWAHFAEALFLSTPAIPEKVKTALIQGAESQGQLPELSRTEMLDHFDERLPELRLLRKNTFDQILSERKELLLSQIELLKSQGIYSEEERLVEKFARIFPNDSNIALLKENRAKRKILGLLQDVIHEKPTWIPIEKYQTKDPETEATLRAIEQSMKDALNATSDQNILSKDFAIAHLMMENEDASLRLLDPKLVDFETQWLRFEALLRARQFLLLIKELSQAERSCAHLPEATFGILYYRALAFWELGQKESAIEIMESISISRPEYRNAIGLLSEWRGTNS